MPDFQNGKSCSIEIHYGPAGFFKDRFGENARTRIEIVYHQLMG
jgi:hypothetical protein